MGGRVLGSPGRRWRVANRQTAIFTPFRVPYPVTAATCSAAGRL